MTNKHRAHSLLNTTLYGPFTGDSYISSTPIIPSRNHPTAAINGSRTMTSDILVNKPTKDMPRIVSSKKVSNITGAIVELDPLATPCCLRLLDCAALLDFDKLQIIEYPPATSIHDNSQTSYPDFSSLPLPPFAAVSYPWRGLQLPPGAAVPSFHVSGRHRR
jgi:hypothetical protein